MDLKSTVTPLQLTLGQAVVIRGALAQAIEEIAKTGVWANPVHVDVVQAYLVIADWLAALGVPRQSWVEEKIFRESSGEITEEAVAWAKQRIEAYERTSETG